MDYTQQKGKREKVQEVVDPRLGRRRQLKNIFLDIGFLDVAELFPGHLLDLGWISNLEREEGQTDK